ncbi:hypothetical protein ElyMa_003161900 [Elysia marginata]|uniref:Uncharacterized protein n=1 Tax=Elysia marginata TaxID=1093978 RepID=A0AAV4IY86_9GAST|nr:hypothetical protein ElyMa_003161900 [Elysia marginata]
MKVHSLTHKSQLVDSLHQLGLSESYDCIMDIKTNLDNNIKSLYSNEEVVCPPQLRTREFAVGAADNIYHNSSSTTSIGPFHGTDTSKELVMTDGTGVSCKPLHETSAIASCHHEEADSRMMVHITDAFHRGYKKIQITSVDTDVVVLAVLTVSKLAGGLEL